MKFSPLLTDMVRADLEANLVPALMGDVGIGKSSFVEDLGKQMGTAVFVVAVNTLSSKEDLTGVRLTPVQTASGVQTYVQQFYPHYDIAAAIEYAKTHPNETPILALDEINRGNSDITNTCLSITTYRKLGEKLPANLRLIVSGNLKGNVVALDDAGITRLVIYNVEPDANTLLNILGPEHMDVLHPAVETVLKEHPELVFTRPIPESAMTDGGEDEEKMLMSFADIIDTGETPAQLTCPRTIEYTCRWLNRQSREQLATYLATPATIGERDVTLLQEVLEGRLGNTEFTTHLIAALAAMLTTSQGSSEVTTGAVKPAVWDQLHSITTRDELFEAMSKLDLREASMCLVYALYDTNDNSNILAAFANTQSTVDKEQAQELIRLLSKFRLSQANLDNFFTHDTPVVENLRPIVALYQ